MIDDRPAVEPFLHHGDVEVMVIHHGDVEHVPSNEWDDDRFTPEEKALFRKLGTEYHWMLPEDLDIRDVWPGLPELHCRIVRFLRRYVWFSSDDQYDTVSTWIIGSYFRNQFPYSPSLIFEGATESVKATLTKCLEMVVYRGSVLRHPSAVAIAKDIEDYDSTIIIDGTDRDLEDRGSDMFALIYSTWDRSRWVRLVPNGRNNIFHTFTSMAMFVDDGQVLSKDLRDRGLTIMMSEAPGDFVLGDVYNIDEDDSSGPSSPREIRRILHEMRMATVGEINGNVHMIDFSEYMRITRQHLTQRHADGRWLYAHALDLPKDSPQIRNHDRNKATTMYSIALATNVSGSVINTILQNSGAMSDEDKDEERVFMAYMQLAKERASDLYAGSDGLSMEQFRRLVRRISTNDIASRFNEILLKNNPKRAPVPTRSVTEKLAALGFRYRSGTARKSWMDADDQYVRIAFLTCVRRYCPEELPMFMHIADEPE